MARPYDESGRVASRYYYRRDLTPRELLVPAVIGAGVGCAVFYVARLLGQRTPLAPAEDRRQPRGGRGARPSSPRRA